MDLLESFNTPALLAQRTRYHTWLVSVTGAATLLGFVGVEWTLSVVEFARPTDYIFVLRGLVFILLMCFVWSCVSGLRFWRGLAEKKARAHHVMSDAQESRALIKRLEREHHTFVHSKMSLTGKVRRHGRQVIVLFVIFVSLVGGSIAMSSAPMLFNRAFRALFMMVSPLLIFLTTWVLLYHVVMYIKHRKLQVFQALFQRDFVMLRHELIETDVMGGLSPVVDMDDGGLSIIEQDA